MSRSVRAKAHVREFLADSITPLSVYRQLREASQFSFLLESVTGGEQVSRYSLMGAGPSDVFSLHQDRLERQSVGLGGLSAPEVIPGAPLEALRHTIERVSAIDDPVARQLPFTGGLVGYFGWDLIRLIERLDSQPPNPFKIPVAQFARFNSVIVFDHAQQRLLGIANEIEGEVSAEEAEAELDGLAQMLAKGANDGAVELPSRRPPPASTGEPSLSDEEYEAAVCRAKEYIAAGDIFQVVLARRWEVQGQIDPLALYRALRVVNPSPYMVLVESPETTLVGASPEMLVRCNAGRLETRPIAGTRRRGKTSEEDRVLAADLLADPKERAEHVMLVDLGRNDLGRVSQAGSVEVESFMEIENYSHVIHIVSSVQSELEESLGPLDSLLACFPAGTLSGAPKIRAMEIIDELEPEARGVYGGVIGYFSYGGDLDTCIAIRTLVSTGDSTSVTAGAGIVADSDPAREAQETRDKAAALLHAVALAEHFEKNPEKKGGGQ